MAEPNAVQKRSLAKMGYAMPDGSYYIRAGVVGASDLQNAIDAVGRGEPQSSHDAIRVHIMRRAKALGLSSKIPADWNADGSLKGAANSLQHYGIEGMRWGHHLPGVEVTGGPGIGTGGGSSNVKPSPFIQRGDHTGDKSGGPSGPSPSQQAEASLSALNALREKAVKQAEDARAEDENADHAPEHGLGTFGSHTQDNSPEEAPPPRTAPSPSSSPSPAAKKTPSAPAAKAAPAKKKSNLTKKQATAVHHAAKKHAANMTQLHNKGKAAHDAHKAKVKKLKTIPNKGRANHAVQAANKHHAANMDHLHKTAQKLHQAHQAHVAKLKKVSPHSQNHNAAASKHHQAAQDKAALAKLSPTQRSALNKLSPEQRAHPEKLTMKQKNDLRLTPAERTALSHLSPKQKAALVRATAASAKARHERALAKKTGVSPLKTQAKKAVTNASTEAARKQTAAAASRRTASQQAAFNKLRLNAQNGTKHDSMGDPEGTYLEHEDDLDLLADSFLEHHGVKGMKWGARRDRGHEGEQVKTAKLAKLDRKFANQGTKHLIDINNKAAQVMNDVEIPRINGKPEYKNADFTHDSPLRRKYYGEYAKALEKHLNEAATELGTNPSGTYKYRAVVNKDFSWNLHAEAVKHADDGSITIHPKYDSKGFIISFGQLSSDEMTQAAFDDTIEEFLAHHGIKGMKWGIRRNGGHPGRSEDHPVSSDAQKAHEVARTINEHGTAAVNNEDLQHLVNRQRLLQQHAQLNPSAPSNYRKGLDFVKSVSSDTKTVLDAVDTGRRALKTINGLSSEVPPRKPSRQSRRTRNKPLRVVDIKAA